MSIRNPEPPLVIETEHYDSFDIASAELLGDGDLQLMAALAALLRRPTAAPIVRLALVANTPEEEWLRIARVGVGRVFDDVSIVIEPVSGAVRVIDLVLIVNVRQGRLRSFVERLEYPAWIYAGPETGGVAEFRVDSHAEVVGALRSYVLAMGVRALVSPSRVTETRYQPEGQWGRLAYHLERRKAAANPLLANERIRREASRSSRPQEAR